MTGYYAQILFGNTNTTLHISLFIPLLTSETIYCCPAAANCLRHHLPRNIATIDDISPTSPYIFVEAWEEASQEVGGTPGQANLQAPQGASAPSQPVPSIQQI